MVIPIIPLFIYIIFHRLALISVQECICTDVKVIPHALLRPTEPPSHYSLTGSHFGVYGNVAPCFALDWNVRVRRGVV